MKRIRTEQWLTAVLVLIFAGLCNLHAADVTWSTGTGFWDTVSTNWVGGATYTDGSQDNVYFGDVAGSGGTITIQDIGGSGGVTPLSTNVSGALDYTFAGNSILGGPLAKSGTGRLTLGNAANSFSSLNLSGGVLAFDDAGQLGGSGAALNVNDDTIMLYVTSAAPTTLTNPIAIADGKTATFDLNHGGGFNVAWEIDGQITGGTAANPVNVVLRELNLGDGNFDDVRLTNSSNSFVGTLTIQDRAEYNWNGDDGVFGDASNSIVMAGNMPSMRLNGYTLQRDISGGRFLNGTISGVVSGAIEVLGNGTLELTNTNNPMTSAAVGANSGGGVLKLTDPGQLGNPGQVQFGTNVGTFLIAGTPTGNWGGRIFVENNAVRYSDVVVEDPAAVVEWTGDVYTRQADQDNLAKKGAGTLNLYDFTVSGTLALNVEEGTLNINDSTPGTDIFGPLAVKSGATLGGTGLIDLNSDASITVDAGGALAPGMSVGTLSVDGDIVINGTLDMEIDGASTYDRLVVANGTIILGAGSELSLDIDTFPTNLYDTFYILDNQGSAAISGTFQYTEGDMIGTFNGRPWMITYLADTDVNAFGGNDIALIAVPEPASGVMLLLATGLLLRRRMR